MKRILNTLAAILMVAILIIIAILLAYTSGLVFALMALMIFGVAIDTLVADGAANFRGSAVFHRSCSNVHWIFISFYLLQFDGLRADMLQRYPDSRPEIYLIGVTAVTFILSVFAKVNTHKVMSATQVAFFSSREQKWSAVLAAVSLCLVVLFSW